MRRHMLTEYTPWAKGPSAPRKKTVARKTRRKGRNAPMYHETLRDELRKEIHDELKKAIGTIGKTPSEQLKYQVLLSSLKNYAHGIRRQAR
jgi:hypothetical protein